MTTDRFRLGLAFYDLRGNRASSSSAIWPRIHGPPFFAARGDRRGACHGPQTSAKNQLFWPLEGEIPGDADSQLEEEGFEPSVPLDIGSGILSRAAPWSEPRERGTDAGFLQITDRPRVAHARDHPLQDRPEVVVDCDFVDRFERVDNDVDLEPGRKRLTAPPNEYEGIDATRGRPNVTGFRQPDSVEVEHSGEVIAELGIMAHPILGEHKCEALSFGAGPRNDGDIGHRSASLLIKAIEEGCNQSGDL